MKKEIVSEEYVSPQMEVQLIVEQMVICESFNDGGMDDFNRENPGWF